MYYRVNIALLVEAAKIRVLLQLPLNSGRTMYDFIKQHRLHVALLKENIFGVICTSSTIVDEKVKILHFHDEDKSWSSILYHSSVSRAANYLYILVWILPELVIDFFEL